MTRLHAAISISRQTWLKTESGKKAVDPFYYLACKKYKAGFVK